MDITNRGKLNYPPRMLEMRRHFHLLGVGLLISIILFALLFLAFLLYYFYQTYAMSISGSGSLHLLNVSISIENAFHFIIYSGAFLFVASVAYYLFFKDVMGAKFQASQKHIACHRKKKEFKIFFEEITSLHCGSFGPLCTFRIKCNNGRVYRFSTMIERADYIIEAILRFNPKLLPWEKFVAFRNKLVLSDHRLARFEESYYGRHSWISVFHLAFLPIVFLSWLYIQQANKMVIHSIVGHVLIGLKLIIITNLGLWGLYQFIYKRIIDKKSFEKLQKNIKDKKRDMHYESTLYKSLYAGVVTLCFVFYSGIYNFDLNRYEFIVALENFENYGQSAGTVHLVDTRYNCQECNFSLKHGDVVVILKPDRPGKYLAKISGFPGEVVKFNDLQDVQTGRSVAAYEERKLNKHELSAITGKKGEYVSLLSEEQIYGKVAMKVMTLPKFNQNFFASMLKISE